MLEYAVSASAIAQGWAGYMISLVTVLGPDLEIPPVLFNLHIFGDISFR